MPEIDSIPAAARMARAVHADAPPEGPATEVGRRE
jgi:hypothetical protein